MVFSHSLQSFRSLELLCNASNRLLRRSRFHDLRRMRWQVLTRRAATSSKPSRSDFPERLLIYHAGTGRTVFIGCLKLTTILLFSFSCLLIGPALYNAPDQPNWMAVGSIIGGAVPMLFVTYTTSPFVTYIHLRIPPSARHSKDMLMEYSRKLPSNAELMITTMRFFGQPKVTSVRLSKLRRVDRRLGVVNLACHATEDSIGLWKRSWLSTGVTQFYVGRDTNKAKEIGVLPYVLRSIKQAPA